jgi:hypothetical protein
MIDQYPSPNGVLTSLIWRKTMSGGETSLSGYDNASQALSYTPGQEQVYLNGILLVRGDDYTATNGTSITGLAALSASDFVQINCYNNFSVATLPTSGLTGTIANNQLQNSSITINGNAVSLGGSVSLPGDIESVTATSPLTGGGSTGALTVGIQEASTSQRGSVQLSDSTSTTSSVLAATPTAVKSAYDLANGAIPKTLTTTTGDIIYASSANTPARLGIGSTNQVLTVSGGVPTWATPAGGGGGGSLTLLQTLTLSGTNSVTTSTFSTAYTNLLIVLVNLNTGSGGNLDGTIRFNGDSSANYVLGGVNGQDSQAAGEGSAGSGIPVISVSNDSNNNGMQIVNVFRYNDSGRKLITSHGYGGISGGANSRYRFLMGTYKGGAITNFTFARSQLDHSYNGGNIYIYGVN